jgi:hypothetical protein
MIKIKRTLFIFIIFFSIFISLQIFDDITQYVAAGLLTLIFIFLTNGFFVLVFTFLEYLLAGKRRIWGNSIISFGFVFLIAFFTIYQFQMDKNIFVKAVEIFRFLSYSIFGVFADVLVNMHIYGDQFFKSLMTLLLNFILYFSVIYGLYNKTAAYNYSATSTYKVQKKNRLLCIGSLSFGKISLKKL